MAASESTKPSIVDMFGWIIPAPLHMPQKCTSAPAMVIVALAVFGTVSVVMIPREAASALSASGWSASFALAMPALILSTGSGMPITPVEATIVYCSGMAKVSASAFATASASWMPCLPMAALATPLFTTIACALPS